MITGHSVLVVDASTLAQIGTGRPATQTLATGPNSLIVTGLAGGTAVRFQVRHHRLGDDRHADQCRGGCCDPDAVCGPASQRLVTGHGSAVSRYRFEIQARNGLSLGLAARRSAGAHKPKDSPRPRC